MNLEPIIQSEGSKRKKDKYHILIHTYIYIYIYMESRKMVLMNLFTSSNREIDIENRFMDTGRWEERMSCMERVTWKVTLPYVK